MTNTHLNINPGIPESSDGNLSGQSKERPTVIEGNVDQFGRRVLQLAGPEMSQAPSLPQSVAELHRALSSPQHSPVSALPAPIVPQSPSIVVVSSHKEASDAKPGIVKSVVGGATLGMLYPALQAGKLLKNAIGLAPSNPGLAMAIGGVAAKNLLLLTGVPIATGVLGRYIGKKFNRPATGAVVGAGLGLGATHLAMGGTAALSTLALPVGVGVAAGAGYYAVRRMLRGR